MHSYDIENILALREDLPKDFEKTSKMPFVYAKDLIKSLTQSGKFCIGAGAAYPEGHIEKCEDKNIDIKYLKEKVDSGVDFLITQLFLIMNYFTRLWRHITKAGIDIPVSGGVMPVLNKSQIKRITQLSGASLPPKFVRMLDKYEYNPEALKRSRNSLCDRANN